MIKYMDVFLELAGGEKCLGFLYMGYFDGDSPRRVRTTIEDKVVWLD